MAITPHFILNNNRYFFRKTSFNSKNGLDWQIIVAVPEADFMAEIQANNQQTVLLSILALAIATTIGILTASWVIKPIKGLNTAAKKIASWRLGYSSRHHKK